MNRFSIPDWCIVRYYLIDNKRMNNLWQVEINYQTKIIIPCIIIENSFVWLLLRISILRLRSDKRRCFKFESARFGECAEE